MFTLIFVSPIDHSMHLHPPCSDALMSNKTQMDGKPQRGGVDQDIVVIETRFTCSVFPFTLHLSAFQHTAIDRTWTTIPIILSSWINKCFPHILAPRGRNVVGNCGGGTWQEQNRSVADTTYLLEVLK